MASVGSSHVRIVWSGSSRCASSRMRFHASFADSCIGTRKRKGFFPGREMLRVRYGNVNRGLTKKDGEAGEDGTGGEGMKKETFVSTVLHVLHCPTYPWIHSVFSALSALVLTLSRSSD